jgi:hypothetical protein
MKLRRNCGNTVFRRRRDCVSLSAPGLWVASLSEPENDARLTPLRQVALALDTPGSPSERSSWLPPRDHCLVSIVAINSTWSASHERES